MRKRLVPVLLLVALAAIPAGLLAGGAQAGAPTAERAIRRCDPIPRPRDGKHERTIVLDMYPVESKQ